MAKTDKPGRTGKRTIAVALAYEPEQDQAPRVVASGRGETAERILEMAFAHDIRVREDADLAELLSAIDVDSVIPLEAFMAVAEILAYVYRANVQTAPFAAGGPTASDGAP